MLSLASCRHDKGGNTAAKSDTVHSRHETNKKDTSFKPYKIADNYLVTDTGYFNIGIGDGVYAVIKRNNKLIDTIALVYGLSQVQDDLYLYYTVKGYGVAKSEDANPQYKKSIMANLGDYTLINNDKKELLNKLTPDFDDYFSSPSVVSNKICYWQIKKLDSTGKIKVSAAMFDPQGLKTLSHYIMDDFLETDDSGYYPQPYTKNDTIYFNAGKDKLMKFSKTFQSYN